MKKKKKLLLLLISILLFIVMFSYIVNNSEVQYTDYNNINKNLEVSTSLEEIDNVVITKVNRVVNITGYGLMLFEDTLTVKNLNSYPISSIFFGIPLNLTEDLVFFKATGINENTLLAERSNMIMNGNEMITIYFDSPLLPHQSTSIMFTHYYKGIVSYGFSDKQFINISMTVFPLLPYKLETDLTAIFWFPDTATDIHAGWGLAITEIRRVSYVYDFIKDEIGSDFITPFLENLGNYKVDKIYYFDATNTKLEVQADSREIFVSPWGIVRVRDSILIQNLGVQSSRYILLYIPSSAYGVYVSDYLGKILGVTSTNLPGSEGKKVTIDLSSSLSNRVTMLPNTSFSFNLEYYLPYENHLSTNWLQDSVEIDLFATQYYYLGKELTITINIDGCYKIDYISDPPEGIKNSQGILSIEYSTDFAVPEVNNVIQFTFTIDIFNLLLRPIVFMIIFLSIASLFVVIVKTRKKEKDISVMKKEYIPVDEIREFCSLFEEKNALLLEIRQIEESAKRKKVSKKTYNNVVTKNNSKIETIQDEIIPFKKMLSDTSDIFDTIIKKLDILEAERTSVEDGLSHLETRYKRGRLPSRSAYLKLSDDFKKRQKKIDRTIDKLIQQFRSYLL